ncbi:hypothetical protein [Vibrio sp. 99-70-13A1]|uniref:hypothetical protein n=1 Tax=Vibrio sp. 99-70-13A1 TaxID=2607601 RepID=UPI0014935F00|nr:hypothetical protein [Vibrio sp. 99-70-13A1]NOH97408.1 hypothetical protein [Vibrio sp. 99-70-13A1]
MTNTLRTIWITVFSIIAMLMSSYTSSSPVMMLDMTPPQAMASMMSDCHLPDSLDKHQTGISSLPQPKDHHSSMLAMSDHAHHDTDSQRSSKNKASHHCQGTSDTVHNCCMSVCSSVSWPLNTSHIPFELSPSLAQYQPLVIGNKVSRIQTLLRPPSESIYI